ncbi:MAG: sensor histidine kinase, partial [Thermodesulfobacteriota bacterium]|nr:sensor histidine kinase [Thermodesulfobacteriota bacterium]
MTGVKAEDMLGRGNYEYAMPFYGTRRPILIDLIFKPDREIEEEYSFVRGEGAALIAEAKVPFIKAPDLFLWGKASPIYDHKGNIIGAIESLRDITDRKQAERKVQQSLKEKEVMLQEIHHRVKNNMQVISSLLNLQAGYVKDEQALELFRECQNRVRTMALIHERLYQSKDLASIDFADYIRSLAGGLLHMYSIDPDIIKLNIHAEDVFLDINKAIPCGLIINELVSNAFKHAFPEGREGEISITLKEDKADNRYTLIVSDNGVSFPVDLDFRETETLGMRLVNILTEQLHGTIEIDRSDGTSFEIVWGK